MAKRTKNKKNTRKNVTLKIDGNPWRVQFVPGLEAATGDLGMCTRYNHSIKIDADQTRLEQESVLLHELLHATWPPDVVGDTTEEKIILALEEKLFAVLHENKLWKRLKR